MFSKFLIKKTLLIVGCSLHFFLQGQNVEIPITISKNYVLMDEFSYKKAIREAQLNHLFLSSEQIAEYESKINSVDSDFYFLRDLNQEYNFDEHITIVDMTPFFYNNKFDRSLAAWIENSVADELSKNGEVIFSNSGIDKYLGVNNFLFVDIIAEFLFESELKVKFTKAIILESGNKYFFITTTSLSPICMDKIFETSKN